MSRNNYLEGDELVAQLKAIGCIEIAPYQRPLSLLPLPKNIPPVADPPIVWVVKTSHAGRKYLEALNAPWIITKDEGKPRPYAYCRRGVVKGYSDTLMDAREMAQKLEDQLCKPK